MQSVVGICTREFAKKRRRWEVLLDANEVRAREQKRVNKRIGRRNTALTSISQVAEIARGNNIASDISNR